MFQPAPAPTTSRTDWKTRKTLIERVGADCQRSWAEFHRIYAGFVASIALKAGVRSPDVDDVSQSIFMEVHRDLTRPEPPCFRDQSFGAWLARKVKWRVIEYHRHRYRKEVATDPVDMEYGACEYPFESVWRREWDRKVLEIAIARVEEKPRNLMIFQALAVERLPVEKVCEMFGISRSNADTIKKRVKDKLEPIVRKVEEGTV